VTLIGRLQEIFPRLAIIEILRNSDHSRSQFYQWCRGVNERRQRPQKVLAEEVVVAASAVIARFPHFGGGKGQAYLLYHRLGLIGQKAFDQLKKKVKRILCQELSGRRDLPGSAVSYEHIRPNGVGEVWAEDFTEVVVEGETFKIALLIDVFSQYILGWSLARRATEALVAKPVLQALAANAGKPPKLFLLADNGKQYTSDRHENLLTSYEIVCRHVPPYVPQYNGSVECGGKEFKNLFFSQWEAHRRQAAADKEKNLLDQVNREVAATVHLFNKEIPKPALAGVAPADVQLGVAEQRRQEIEQYRQAELDKPEPPPPSRPVWEVVKEAVKAEMMSTKELLTRLAFFGRRPLRRIAQLNREVWGS
jgi:transposase InsO family protein